MSKIFSCGEAGNMKLVLNIDKHNKKLEFTHLDEKFERVLDLKNRKTKNKIEKQKGEKKEFKLATGSKILKIENEKELKELITKYHGDPEKAINAKTSGPTEFFENLSKDYQGIYVSRNVIENNPKLRSITGDKEGLRVLDTSVLKDADDKNPEPFRKGMNNSANALSVIGKQLDNTAYEGRLRVINSGALISSKKDISNAQINREVKKFGKIINVSSDGKVITLGEANEASNDVVVLNCAQINNMRAVGETFSNTIITPAQAIEARIAYQRAFMNADKKDIINSTNDIVNCIQKDSETIYKAAILAKKYYEHLVKHAADNTLQYNDNKSTRDMVTGMVAAIAHNDKKNIDATLLLGRMPLAGYLNAPKERSNEEIRRRNVEIYRNMLERRTSSNGRSTIKRKATGYRR